MDNRTTEVQPRPLALPGAFAAVIVFVAAAAVLVLETLALRLIAPYVGVTLQTNTAVIGAALLAIAAGAWSGGRAADRVADPLRLIGPMLLAGAGYARSRIRLERYGPSSPRCQ